MSNIQCIDFYDLCRICTANCEQRINIFSTEGRSKNLTTKIAECLAVNIDEKDRLPKMICVQCLQHVENIYEFRNVSKNSQDTLNSWLNKATLQNGEKVFIKDAVGNPNKSVNVLSGGNAQVPVITSAPCSNIVQNPIQNNNLLNTIMQAVSSLQQQTGLNQQYTITVDNKPMQNNMPVEYKIESSPSTSAPIMDDFNSGKSGNNESFEEFIKLKPDIKITPIGKKPIPKPQPVSQQQQQTTFQHIQQQLQQHLQQEWQQQQLKQHIQQLTSQLQAQSQITITAPSGLAAVTTTQPNVTNSSTISQTEDSLSPNKKKPKLNFVLSSPTQQTYAATNQPQIQLQLQPSATPQPSSSTQTLNAATILSKLATQQTAQANVLSPNKCFLPITIRDENSDQQIVAHIDAKNFMLPTTYQVQMKFLPQLATADGQPIMELTPTSIPATLQLTPQALTNSTFQAASVNTSATPMQTHIQQLLLDSSQQQQQRQTGARVTSQQIIRTPNKSLTVGNIAHVNNNSTVISPVSNNTTINNPAGDISNFKTPTLVKSEKFKMTPQTNIIDIKPTTHLTQQIMEQVKHQMQVKQQEQNGTSAARSIMPPLQHAGLTVQRIHAKTSLATNTKTIQPTGNTTMTSTALRTVGADAAANATTQQQIPIINKQNITISRITTQNVQPQTAVQKQKPTTTKVSSPQNPRATQQSATQSQKQLLQAQLSSPHKTASVLNKVSVSNGSPTKRIVQKTMPKLVATNSTQSATEPASSCNISSPPSKSTMITTVTLTANRKVQSTPNAASKQMSGENNVFSSPPSMLQHTCTTCNRSFKKKEHLTQHAKLHAGLRPFKCTEENCNKAFSRKEHLLRHLVSHTGKKMFSCDVCQKPFSRKDNLNKHKRVHNIESTEPTYQCEICSKKFEILAFFEVHKMKHHKSDSKTLNVKQDDKIIKTPQIKFKSEMQQQTQIVASKMQVTQRQQQQQQVLVSSPSNTQTQPAQQKQVIQMQQPHVVATQNLAGNTITITQAPTSLQNYVQLGFSQFENAASSGQNVFKIEK